MDISFVHKARMLALFKIAIDPERAVDLPSPKEFFGNLYDVWQRIVSDQDVGEEEVKNIALMRLGVSQEEIESGWQKARSMGFDEFKKFYLYWLRFITIEKGLQQAQAIIYDPLGAAERLREVINHEAFIAYGPVETADDVVDRILSLDPIKIGYPKLDKLLMLTPGEFVLIAARPSVGKTTLMINMAIKAAESTDPFFANSSPRVGFISLEMAPEEIVTRMLMAYEMLPTHELKAKFNKIKNKPKVKNLLKQIALYSGSSYLDAVMSYMRVLLDKGVRIFFIDYIQLMALRDRTENRVIELSTISRTLKIFARDNRAIVIAGSQLSRESVKGDDEPDLHHLRGSGGLEQDADSILFIIPKTHHVEAKKAVRILSLKKHRNGPTGVVGFIFDKQIQKFIESRGEQVIF